MRISKLLVVLSLSVLIGNGAAVAAENYDKGVNAYSSGDYETALSELAPLAEQGVAEAQGHLGLMYKLGMGVQEDYKTAIKWLTLASEQGYAQAQSQLGNMYTFGLGVPEDHKKAVEWYTLAAEQGDSNAQTSLGYMYSVGEGVLLNNKSAVKWYVQAAEQGHAGAQHGLGIMYRTGEGVLIDYVRAYMWFSLSAYNGEEYSKAERESVAKKMTPTDVSKAQSMARHCLESDYMDCGMTEAEQIVLIQEVLGMLKDSSDSLEQQANSGAEVASSVQYIIDEIRQRWVRPANARNGMVVEIVIQLVPTGEVVDIEVSYRDASATDAFVSSIVKAVKKVGRFGKLSQLNPELFDANFRKLTVKFKPEDLRL
jgi:hypothetical protein